MFNTNSPLRRLIKHRPDILGSPDRTSSSVSSYSYSLENDNDASSTGSNTSNDDENSVDDTTNTDTNMNQRRESSTSSRFLSMLGMFAMLSIFLLSLVTPVGYTTNLPIQVLNKSTGDTMGSSTSTSTEVSIYIDDTYVESLLNSEKGIPHLSAKDFARPQLIPASKRVKKKDDSNKSILYMMQLDLPNAFMVKIRTRCNPLWFLLTLTKIGHSQDWPTFLQKMQTLQMYTPFCRLRYIAIEHNHPSEVAEKAMHYVFMAYHVKGEWYNMNNINKMYLASKFPGSNIYRGYTTRPGRGSPWPSEEGLGHVYLAKFDWDTRASPTCLLGELETIRGILGGGPVEPVEHKDIAEDMLLTKIGSAGVSRGLNKRLSDYTYAQPYANMTYHAFPHRTIRQQELDIQNVWDPYWKVGEWYALSYPEDWYTIGNLTYPLPTNIQGIQFEQGVYHRTREQTNILRHNLVMWYNLGLVTNFDIAINILRGLVDNTGMPL